MHLQLLTIVLRTDGFTFHHIGRLVALCLLRLNVSYIICMFNFTQGVVFVTSDIEAQVAHNGSAPRVQTRSEDSATKPDAIARAVENVTIIQAYVRASKDSWATRAKLFRIPTELRPAVLLDLDWHSVSL
jgi:hypothetical protein